MSSIISKFKDLINGFLLFILIISGLAIALMLRFYNFNGNMIVLISVLVELVGIIMCYLILKNLLEEKKTTEVISKKKVK